jgi:hypothetical protein
MPQKLIRLTSESGDGIFNGIFNEEIEIKQDSEIALQSLSVERESQQIIITGANGNVAFSSVESTGNPYQPNQLGTIIPQGLYDKTNYTDLLKNIGNAMNRVCNLNTVNSQWGIQHGVSVATSGNIQFRGLQSPFYQIQKPVQCDFVVNDRAVVNFVPSSEVLNVWEEFQTDEYGMWRETDTTTGGGPGGVALNESYVFGTIPCIKSTGIFRTRFKRLNTNGAGAPSFTMGLVKGDDGLAKLQGASFTLSDCVYAIRANGHNAAMQYLREKDGAWISTVTPVNHTTADWEDNLNDVIDISFIDGGVEGVITSETAGVPTRTTLGQALGHEVGSDYYWFISMHEGKDNCVLDLTGVTLDPFGVGALASIKPNNVAPGIIDESEITGLPLFEEGGDLEFTPAVELSVSLSKYLGFNSSYLAPYTIIPPVNVGNFDQRIGYVFEAQKGFDNSYDSDTYLVDTQSFTLDSFDSFGLRSQERNANSGGSRRNIIATVPITETPIAGSSNSLIQYEPSNLYYVAIKNRGDIVTRQIRCRLLTGQYNAVETQGLASLVLLIKEPYD